MQPPAGHQGAVPTTIQRAERLGRAPSAAESQGPGPPWRTQEGTAAPAQQEHRLPWGEPQARPQWGRCSLPSELLPVPAEPSGRAGPDPRQKRCKTTGQLCAHGGPAAQATAHADVE